MQSCFVVSFLQLTSTLVPIEMSHKTNRTFTAIASDKIHATILTHETVVAFIGINTRSTTWIRLISRWTGAPVASRNIPARSSRLAKPRLLNAFINICHTHMQTKRDKLTKGNALQILLTIGAATGGERGLAPPHSAKDWS